MSWRFIYIKEADYLNLHLDSLVIKNGTNELKVPLSDINSLIIDNYKTTLTTNLINKCIEYKINIVICDMYHLPHSLIYPYDGYYKTSYMQLKQLEWEKETLEIIWSKIVLGKLTNQLKVLEKNKKSETAIGQIKLLIKGIKLGDKTNREGLAGKIYFRALFGKDFTREEETTINACLNYGYSIIRSMISRTLIAKGLNAHIGIFHKGPNNAFNLSDDIIEVFRPIIDNFVYKKLINTEYFTKNERIKLMELVTKKYKFENQNQTLSNIIIKYIDNIIKAIEIGEIDIITFPDIEEVDV